MAFGYYAPVTIDNTKVGGSSGSMSNYPVLIKGTYAGAGGTADLRTTANGGKVQNSSGYDIYFYSDSDLTTKLDHELISYTATTGAIIAWVRIPTLNKGSDTTFYMAYGDSGISADPSTTDTWSVFDTVVHGHETASSTSSDGNARTLTDANVTIGTTSAKILNTRDYNGSSSKTTIANATNNINGDTTRTIQCWLTPDAVGDVVWSADNSTEFYLYTLSPDEWRYRDQNSGSAQGYYDTNNANYSTGSTYLVHCNINGTTLNVYQNGAVLTGSTTGTPQGYNQNDNIVLGTYNNDSLWYDGRIEEFRVSTSLLDGDWILTDYNTMNSPSTFYAVGSETEAGGGDTVIPLRTLLGVGV